MIKQLEKVHATMLWVWFKAHHLHSVIVDEFLRCHTVDLVHKSLLIREEVVQFVSQSSAERDTAFVSVVQTLHHWGRTRRRMRGCLKPTCLCLYQTNRPVFTHAQHSWKCLESFQVNSSDSRDFRWESSSKISASSWGTLIWGRCSRKCARKFTSNWQRWWRWFEKTLKLSS